MVDPTAVGSDISRLVQSSPEGRILGSELAVLLKRGYPDFRPENFACRNLRGFIRKFAKEFTENLTNESTKAELGKVLNLESWWTHFFVAARRLNVESLWSAYRRRRLHAEFEQQLKTLGVPLPLSSSPLPVSVPVAVPP